MRRPASSIALCDGALTASFSLTLRPGADYARSMTHEHWLVLVKPALKLSRTRRAEAVRQLLSIARRSRRAGRINVSSWHAEQCLATAAIILDDLKRYKEAAALRRRLAREQRSWAVYYLRATVSSLSAAADSLESSSSLRESRKVREQAAAVTACLPLLGVDAERRPRPVRPTKL
jgi:hypothetical protein